MLNKYILGKEVNRISWRLVLVHIL